MVRRSTDVEIRAPSVTTAIPAESYRVLRLPFTPLGSGTLQILGISTQLPLTMPCFYKIPGQKGEDAQATDKRRSITEANRLRTKNYGLARYTTSTETTTSQDSGPPYLSLSVTAKQPLLLVKRTNLTHGTLMLYDGER
jgi:hypothetical protein